jgi:hypothetical protein
MDLNVKTLRTTDAKILPKGCQLRWGEFVPHFVNHHHFHKWLMPLPVKVQVLCRVAAGQEKQP